MIDEPRTAATSCVDIAVETVAVAVAELVRVGVVRFARAVVTVAEGTVDVVEERDRREVLDCLREDDCAIATPTRASASHARIVA